MGDDRRQDRRHAEEGDEGHRTPFERDRDAVLYTTSFRRLGGVTQVVSPAEGLVYHNRLTHTLEVAQIARRLTEKICGEQPELARSLQLTPDVVETGALVHDLGHPPFGHVAEKELNRLVRDAGVDDGYEGNAQSFRIVTKLAVRNSDPGLNLTRASLNATLKYPWFHESDGSRSKKWGAYVSERDDFRFARGSHGEDSTKCLEAQLMDWADDIAYSIHDTEDFYRAGLVPLGQLANDANFVKGFIEKVFLRWRQKEISSRFSEEDLANQFARLCEAMPFQGPYEPTRRQRSLLRLFTSDFIGRYITNTSILLEPDEDGSFLAIDDEFRMEVTMLKELTWQFVIKSASLIGMQHGQRNVIRTLFDVFANAVKSNDFYGRWPVLPARDRAKMESLQEKFGNSIPHSERIRVAADAVAGLTDQQAVLMYHRLTGISAGSVLDSIVV